MQWDLLMHICVIVLDLHFATKSGVSRWLDIPGKMDRFPLLVTWFGDKITPNFKSDALSKLFDEYSYQDVNIIVYIFFAKCDDFRIQALQTHQSWGSASAC